MKRGVRAIIIEDNNLLVMKRDKFGKQYYTLIGGHVGLGESLEKALLREIHEETMVHTANPRLVYVEEANEPYGTQYIYVCDYISGVPILHPDADERKINKGGQNIYTPMWLPLNQLQNVPFVPKKLAQKILRHYKNGFPEQPQTFKAEI